MDHQVETFPAALRRLRGLARLTQEELAERAGVTPNTVYRWERGRGLPRPAEERRLALALNVPVEALHVHRTPARPDPLAFLEEPPIGPQDPRVAASQEAWAQTRRALNANRAMLTELAARVYPDGTTLDGTTLLTLDRWLPDRPIDLADTRLTFDASPPPVAVDGTEPASSHVRPLADLTRQFPRYTAAVRVVAPPALFENRPSWRLLDAEPDGHLTFGDCLYFESMDHHEALGHEMAYVHLDADGRPAGKRPTLRDLPFRRLIGNPFDLERRPAIASISTMVIRNGPEPTFLMHRRDSGSVAIAGGQVHVIPSGIFQPSSLNPAGREPDFDIWRNVSREWSEELLGNPEHDGEGRPIDYTAEPFATLDAARAAGALRAAYLGVGLDALTLAAEILTTVVLDPDVYDRMAADFVLANDEGRLVAEPAPFNEATIKGLLESGRVASAATGLLSLAWRHRDTLLGARPPRPAVDTTHTGPAQHAAHR